MSVFKNIKDFKKEVVGNAVLFNEDCLKVMPEIADKSIDMILCDLPYGTTACKWDVIIPFDKMWQQYERIIKDNGIIVLFASQPFTSLLIASNIKKYKYSWIWEKDNASNFFQAKFTPLNDTEDICVFSNGGCNNGTKNPIRYKPQGIESVNIECVNGKNVGGMLGKAHKTAMSEGKKYTQTQTGYPFKTLKFKRDSNKIHETQKPIALIEYLIKTYTDEGELILDNTFGSNTTGLGCKNLNRNYIGIEMNETHFKNGTERIKTVI